MSYVSTDIKKIIAEIIENKKEKGGVKNIYFVGCGGSLGALYPAKTFMEREAQVLRSAWINSNEFVHSTPKDFGENSMISDSSSHVRIITAAPFSFPSFAA